MRKIRDTLDVISFVLIVIMCVVTICNLIFFNTAEVSGPSMNPTFTTGDLVLIKKNTKSLKRFDKVVAYSNDLEKELCKRVVGLPNDTVVITNGVLRVNNKVIKEDYIYDKNWNDGTVLNVKLGKNEVFLLGDNRNDSTDSRELGTFKTENINGIIVADLTRTFGITKAKYIFILVVMSVFAVLELIITGIERKREKNREIK